LGSFCGRALSLFRMKRVTVSFNNRSGRTLIKRLTTRIQELLRKLLPAGPWRPLKRPASVALVIIGISSLIVVVQHIGWLDRFETTSFDIFNILHSSRDPTHVVIVGITDDDYKTQFGSTSPLNPKKLQDIIGVIAAANPRVIGIDVFTSSSHFESFRAPPSWPPIVWAEDAIQVDETLDVIPPLGGQANKLLREHDDVGVAALPMDADGVVRRYHRELPTNTGAEKSFPWAIVTASCRTEFAGCNAIAAKTEPSKRGLLLNFAGERFNFSPLSATHVLLVGGEQAWRENGPLKDKIVLVGGFFRDGRDVHQTPVGRMAGVQLEAQVIESELSGGGIRPIDEFIAFIVDVVAGVLLVIVHHLFRVRTALILNLLGIPLLSILCSFFAFSSFSRWFSFVPVIVGVLIHELYERAA